ncbi:transcription factor grauzone isoform X4 [Stomoxys calcitrans]|uniref:transcription factor grauzone isoform X4 n=1 Tax=Stomoxys calcitrans TaxID=35570 RepID=UPI0027E22EE9|nr:transcription factor grauzone isoform X4 [Stomoxys calcitrans]XP_013114982.2 transcription factor grauzone isoform X4 [Stomoxys calcitrans]
MPQSRLCRLCVKACKDYKSLYQENGLGNELYDSIRKYFHPMILDINKCTELRRVCLECWHRISEFSDYEEAVRVAQLKLFAEVQEERVIIKNEKGEFEDGFTPTTSKVKVEDELIAPCSLKVQTRADDTESKEILRASNHKESELKLNHVAKVKIKVETDSFYDLCDSELLRKEEKNWSELELTTGESDEQNCDLSSDYESPGKKCVIKNDQTKEPLLYHPDFPSLEDNILSSELELTDSDLDEQGPCSTTTTSNPSKIDFEWLRNSAEQRKRRREQMEELMAKYTPILKCIACPETFTNLKALQSHFHQLHPKERFYVMCCNLKLPVPTRFREHLILHSDPEAFNCKLCWRTYTLRSGLKNHMILRHPQAVEPKIFSCKKCHKCYDTSRRLSYHVKIAHMENIPQPQRQKKRRRPRRKDIPPDGPSAFTCEECGKQFDKYRSYSQHQWYSHRLEPTHTCVTCGKGFKLKYDLRKHEAIHTGYACAFCPRTFESISDLYTHRNAVHADTKGNFVRK